MVRAIVIAGRLELHAECIGGGFWTVRRPMMVCGCLGRRQGIAQHRAERPGYRKDAQYGQHDDADGAQVPTHDVSIPRHSVTRRNRRAFPMTDTELKVIAALAIIGLSSSPKNG